MQRSNEFVTSTNHKTVNNKLNDIIPDHIRAMYKQMCIFTHYFIEKTKPVIKPNHKGKRTTNFVIKHDLLI